MLAMGETGLKDASIYIAVSTISFQIISIMAGEFALSGKFSLSGLGGILKRLTVNPLIISCALGIGLALAGLRTIPGVFDETMKLMGGAATAIALLALGGTLDLSRISSIYNMIKATWHDCLIKLVIHPIILWVLLLALSVPEPLLKVTVMLSSMPSAVNCFIMAKEMKMDSDYADLVASTTVLGIISIPVWANILLANIKKAAARPFLVLILFLSAFPVCCDKLSSDFASHRIHGCVGQMFDRCLVFALGRSEDSLSD